MKRSQFKNELRYKFASLVYEAGGYSHHFYQVFDDFLSIAFYAMQQGEHMYRTKTMNSDIENKVINLQRKYSQPKKFNEAFAVLVDGLTEKSYDFLGQVYMEADLGNVKGAGQCFTPDSICELMADLTLNDLETDKYTWCKPLVIDDPAVGGGATLINAGKTLRKQNMPIWKYFLTGADVDFKCVAMSYVQLTLLGHPVIIRYQNTLSLETWGVYPNFLYTMYRGHLVR